MRECTSRVVRLDLHSLSLSLAFFIILTRDRDSRASPFIPRLGRLAARTPPSRDTIPFPRARWVSMAAVSVPVRSSRPVAPRRACGDSTSFHLSARRNPTSQGRFYYLMNCRTVLGRPTPAKARRRDAPAEAEIAICLPVETDARARARLVRNVPGKVRPPVCPACEIGRNATSDTTRWEDIRFSR